MYADAEMDDALMNAKRIEFLLAWHIKMIKTCP